MAFRDSILPLVHAIRAIPGTFGVHRHQVWVRKRTWSGTRVGEGTVTLTDTRILNNGQDPHVLVKKSEDQIAGLVDSIQFEVGPITPEFPGGGTTPATLDPTQTATPTDFVYVVKGPGLPATGVECKKVRDTMDRPFRYMVWLQSTGRTA